MISNHKKTTSGRTFLGAALLLAALLLGAGACGPSGPTDTDQVHITATTEYANAVPGRNLTLVWRFLVAPDWHLYWTGRNDSGFAPTIDLELPDGWVAGGLQWPAPERHLSEGDILDHVYYKELVLLQQVGVPEAAPTSGEVELKAKVAWLACKDSCVPGQTDVTVAVALAPQAGAGPSERASEARSRLPQPLPADLLTTRWQTGTFHLAAPQGAALQFMPTADCGELVDLIEDGTGTDLALRFRDRDGTVGPVRGLIVVTHPNEEPRAYTADFPAQLLEPQSPGG